MNHLLRPTSPGSRALLCVIALAGGILASLAMTASGSGKSRSAPPMDLRINVSKADSTIGMSVQAVVRQKGARCEGQIRIKKRTLRLPKVALGQQLAAQWTWRVAGRVPAGRWVAKVRCRVGKLLHERKRSVPVDHGIGPGGRGDIATPGTFLKRAVPPTDLRPGGQGGSNAASLYPQGQCTWWVASTFRQDLPYFPGESGNALNWAKSAAKYGFKVGDRPITGAVAVFQPGQQGAGQYGHVAYVLEVKPGDQIQISEANFDRKRLGTQRSVDWRGLKFIYGGLAGDGPVTPTTTTPPTTTGTTVDQVPPPPDPPRVSLSAPRDGQVAQGTQRVTATANAPAVRFEVFHYANPAQFSTGRTVVLGTDATPEDGFAIDWDTTSVLNQGGPGGSSVVVRAVAVDAAGRSLGVDVAVRVNVANSVVVGGTTVWPYYVVGACAEGECFLNTRSGPGFSSYASTGQRQDGDQVNIVCQAIGERVQGLKGASSVWDKLLSGDWVADYYVDTPELDAFSPPIPRC